MGRSGASVAVVPRTQRINCDPATAPSLPGHRQVQKRVVPAPSSQKQSTRALRAGECYYYYVML